MIKTIKNEKSSNPYVARIAADNKNLKNYTDNIDFFGSKEHIAKVNAVEAIVMDFFKVYKEVYINFKVNKKSKATVLKVAEPMFPNHLSYREKQDMFYKPLEKLGIEIKLNKTTCSYLFHVK